MTTNQEIKAWQEWHAKKKKLVDSLTNKKEKQFVTVSREYFHNNVKYGPVYGYVVYVSKHNSDTDKREIIAQTENVSLIEALEDLNKELKEKE